MDCLYCDCETKGLKNILFKVRSENGVNPLIKIEKNEIRVVSSHLRVIGIPEFDIDATFEIKFCPFCGRELGDN